METVEAKSENQPEPNNVNIQHKKSGNQSSSVAVKDTKILGVGKIGQFIHKKVRRGEKIGKSGKSLQSRRDSTKSTSSGVSSTNNNNNHVLPNPARAIKTANKTKNNNTQNINTSNN